MIGWGNRVVGHAERWGLFGLSCHRLLSITGWGLPWSVCTVHLESIQTPSLSPHFVTLKPYSKIDFFFNPHQIPYIYIFRAIAMRLEIEFRCILFPLIILEMFLQLDLSPPVLNLIDWTWFGKAHTWLYKVPQLAVHVRAKTKPWGQRHFP